MKALAQKLLPLTLLLAACGDPTDAAREAPNSRWVDRINPSDAARQRRVGLAEGARVYFVAEMDGRRFSSGYTTRTRSVYNGVPALVTETEQRYEMLGLSQQRLQQVDYRKVIANAATGESLYLTENVERDGAMETRTITIDRGRALFRTLDRPEQNSEMAVPSGVLFAVTPDWILAQKPQVGKKYSAAILDRSELQIVAEEVEIRDFGPTDVLGASLNVWTVDIRRGENSLPTRMIFTQDGALVSMQSDNLKMRIVPQPEATLDYVKMESVRSMPVTFQLPAWDNFNALTYRPTPAEKWRELLPDDDRYQKFDGNELKLLKNTPAVGDATFPLAVPPELLPFCRRGENVYPDEREIADRAKDIVGGENRVLSAVAMLAGWVYQNIALDEFERDDSPLTTMQRRAGDAARQARLFASLARSLNLPTRLCGGLLIMRDNATRHVWCEVNINGRWLPVDPTVNRVGLPAGYVLTEVEQDGNGVLASPFAWAMRDGGIGLEFVSATKNYTAPDGKTATFELFPEVKKTYVAVEGNWIANLYWGFSIVKPENWRGNINLQSVTVASDGDEAVIKIEALNKVFPCTKAQLEMVVGSLQSALSGFKLLSSDLARFGARRNPAMYADFIALQEGARRRCQIYVIPLRGRSYRVMVWAPADDFEKWETVLKETLATISM
ncbi:hypothetical protein FACS1894139_16840 [Planctomycetales bacterium]|nr:hypothetical protein FACS1894107_15750 [Planctomycetales bacterium]GHT07876.1 hypothetical protein FACS1894139_16840 [Planctomycetales bacterium]GHV21578.1 hypothetical protein AGMMS49959_10930 [Planctomycetales bacterium]